MELADHERPPMIRIPEYLEKRRLAAAPAAAVTEALGDVEASPVGEPR
jgi:hypothetical protein